MDRVLLLVDLQNDFFTGGSLAIPGSDVIIPVANEAIALCMRYGIPVVACQDWHPRDHSSFAINASQQVNTTGLLNDIPHIWWPVHCVQDSYGANFHPDLCHEGIHIVFPKGKNHDIDSYSAFFDNGHRVQTALDSWLRSHGINRLTLLGLATDYCVKYSVLDALYLGYAIEVLIDGCCGVNLQPGDSIEAIQQMVRYGAELLTFEMFAARII